MGFHISKISKMRQNTVDWNRTYVLFLTLRGSALESELWSWKELMRLSWTYHRSIATIEMRAVIWLTLASAARCQGVFMTNLEASSVG